MAIYSSVAPPEQQEQHPVGVDIDAWAASAISSLNLQIQNPYDVSAHAFNTSALTIPLDEPTKPSKTAIEKLKRAQDNALGWKEKERERLAKEKAKKREIAEKGKEGSRRRQRWENDRLIGVPGAQPPRDEDWEVRRIGPVRKVAYWVVDGQKLDNLNSDSKSETKPVKPEIPSDLKKRCKRKKAAKDLLRGLEEEVRGFVAEWAAAENASSSSATSQTSASTSTAIDDVADSSDEEIVFVGRDLSARTAREAEEKREKAAAEAAKQKLAQKPVTRQIDAVAPLARYFVHVLATYYGLKSWSVDSADKKRIPVIGVKAPKIGACHVPNKMLCDFV